MPTKAKRSRRSNSKKKADPPAWQRDAAWWASTSLTVVIVCAVLFTMVAGRRSMRSSVSKIRAVAPAVEFEWPASRGHDGQLRTWLDAGTRRMLQDTALDYLDGDRFHAESMQDAQEALMRTGWFASPCRLSRTAEGTVRVRGTWRIPSAVVRTESRDVLVSLDGVRLPLEYRINESGRKVIVGAQLNPPQIGARWDGGDVQAGIALLDFIKRDAGYHQVLGVDVSDFLGGTRLTLVTDRGNRIRWGGPVQSFNAGQATDGQKRRRLQYLFESTGRIDGNQALVDLSLMHAPEFVADQTITPGTQEPQ